MWFCISTTSTWCNNVDDTYQKWKDLRDDCSIFPFLLFIYLSVLFVPCLTWGQLSHPQSSARWRTLTLNWIERISATMLSLSSIRIRNIMALLNLAAQKTHREVISLFQKQHWKSLLQGHFFRKTLCIMFILFFLYLLIMAKTVASVWFRRAPMAVLWNKC